VSRRAGLSEHAFLRIRWSILLSLLSFLGFCTPRATGKN
jgi:hypothetical protein